MQLPDDVIEVIFSYLVYSDLNSCYATSRRCYDLITSNAVLGARVNMRKAMTLFNEKADLGIDFATSIGLIYNTPEDIARFLNRPKLCGPQLGTYLGFKANKRVLREMVHTFDFAGLHLDVALRKCVVRLQLKMTNSTMRLLLHYVASRFCECNPHYFCESVDDAAETAYLLCFAMLMLNTDAHNHTVLNKMTRKQFVAYVSSSLNLKVNIAYLEGIYDRITTYEIRPEPPASGYLSGARPAALKTAMRWVTSIM
eukprot:NODE_618_length_1263_cov_108.783361_g446_i0.p1 GENE.NODE_618_length_1263_cov_108.783361_g446_i0~~NODE_618_length_1263_cov_108.783361_g446_i0.p1  ORF type:complete len:255 (+),score=28.48 NODE_618_length_1263_cov_108.783361_g446_i0:81-845(+)